MNWEKLEIVLCKLLHEAFVRLDLAHELTEHLKTVLQFDTLIANQVGQNESSTSALAFNWVDKDLAATIKSLIDEAIRDAEVFLGILLRLVIDVQVQVLEVTVSLGVGLTGDIQDVRDSSLDELASLECALEGSHEDTSVDFKQDDVS